MLRALLIVAAAAIAFPLPAAADGSDFPGFCKSWMKKLEAREADNLRKVTWERGGSGVVGEYVGYGRQPLRCKTRPIESGAIGTLVYEEIRYRRSGGSSGEALKAKPKVVQTTEVMELFRYDGRAWRY